MSSPLGTFFRILQQLFCSQSNNEQPGQPVSPQTHPHPHLQPQSQPQAQPDITSSHPAQQPPHTPPHAQGHGPHRPYKNENLINQNNEYYKQLRARAKEEGDAMARCFEESHQAYEAHEGARAKELSNEGHAHQSKMNELNAQASDWIFQANNTDSKPGEVDLHGLYVKEAITHTERAVHEARSRGDSEIRLIVGKGIHSQDHIAKLEPAIENLMQKYNIVAHLDEHNSGVLVVTLDGSRNDRTLELNDITRRLERKDEDCVIM